MEDPKRNRVIEKINKLLNLAQNEASTEAEAALATERAYALLAEHNLEIEQIRVENIGRAVEEEVGNSYVVERYNERWRRVLMHGSADLNFCYYFYQDVEVQGLNSSRIQRGIRHNFVGRPHNMEVAKLMGIYLVNTVNRLANEGARKLAREQGRSLTSTERGQYVNSFRYGAARRIYDRIKLIIDTAAAGNLKTESGSNLPALVTIYAREKDAAQAWLKSYGVALTKAKSRSLKLDSRGYSEGKTAGASVNLSGQIGGKTSSPRMIK